LDAFLGSAISIVSHLSRQIAKHSMRYRSSLTSRIKSSSFLLMFPEIQHPMVLCRATTVISHVIRHRWSHILILRAPGRWPVGPLTTHLDATLDPLPALVRQNVRPRHQGPCLSRPLQAALSALPSTVICHPNHDCVRTLKTSTRVKGQGRNQVSRTIEHGDEESDEGDVSDGNGSVSGTDFGSLTSVE